METLEEFQVLDREGNEVRRKESLYSTTYKSILGFYNRFKEMYYQV